ncbi:hypothetical protein O0I10_010736 [Lichtheimia ornata]|uniref:Uncharacterized protein n=1 Tax=Lichtheimia ornata TaxID=688661 RepID=A0AAD7UU36_9FUNG|nr:uncharacterized protein O0I10_010736 [Lichtheimia ornata]KAJ8653589.1 hypothetical protein O0I10_010736 [Lichtheimia ornata]
MGNCFGKRNKGGHTLGGNTTTSAATPGSSQSPTQQQQGSQRDAMLAAAERRRQEAENRGVKQGGAGGKLSKQLAEQKRQNPMQADSNELPERMVWD